MVYAPRDNHQYLIISPQNHTLLLLTKHPLGHIKLSRDKLFLVALVSDIASFTGIWLAIRYYNGDKALRYILACYDWLLAHNLIVVTGYKLRPSFLKTFQN